MLTLSPGIYRDINKSDYLSDPCERPSLSTSIAKLLISRSPMHAWSAHPRGGNVRSDPTAPMIRGTILDSLLLGGDSELVESPYDEYRTNEAKAWKAATFAKGQIPIKSAEFQQAKRAARGIRERLEQKGIILDGENQLTLVWKEGDVWCRGRPDHWKKEIATIYDLKIVDDASNESVQRKMLDFGYDIQYAAYTRGFAGQIPELEGRLIMKFIFAEPEPPYAVNIKAVDGTMKTLGNWKWETAVKEWGIGLETGHWRGYDDAPVSAPAYAMAKMDEALVGGGSKAVPF